MPNNISCFLRVTSSDLTKLKQVNSPEGVVGAVSPENPNPLPYYKFAHVKRSVRPLRFVHCF